MGSGIHIIGLEKLFSGRSVLRGLDVLINPGRITGIVGRSGAGKTTLLRILAGLDNFDRGKLVFVSEGGSPLEQPVRVGMLFQDLALWPHLKSWDHLELVLSSVPKVERQRRIAELFHEVKLPDSCWESRPPELSGGEAQRLALARALANDPDLLLLDEPLAQLDALLRSELLQLIRDKVGSRGTSLIYVTHAWSEVSELCDDVVVMEQGRAIQSGTLSYVFWRPVSPLVAQLTGPVCEMPGDLLEGGAVTCDRSAGLVPAFETERGSRVLFRPQQVRVVNAQEPNRWMVQSCMPHGAGWRLELVRGPHFLNLFSPMPAPLQRETGIHLIAAAPASGPPT